MLFGNDIDWTRWPNFTANEFRCKCGCGVVGVDPDFMDKLQDIRNLFGKPMRINSGYRCPDHNNIVSSTGFNGPHTKGAADIGIAGPDARTLLNIADEIIQGIGINQKGAGRFIHLDMQGWRVWTY